ncbi:MAG: hypothetical protein ABIK09_19865 [Pseudomonadota bacterium]
MKKNIHFLRLLGTLVITAFFGVGCDDGDPCGGYEADYEALVAGAKTCSVATDCQVLQVDCQMRDRCVEYTDLSLTAADLDSLTDAWQELECGGAGGHSCCDAGAPPAEAACIEGSCVPEPEEE